MDTETKEQLLDRFRAYLDKLPEATPVESAETDRRTDLYSLFAELAALKNEVRLESRQVKTALDEFRAVFETLQASQMKPCKPAKSNSAANWTAPAPRCPNSGGRR